MRPTTPALPRCILRRDALAAAARWTSFVERTARATPGVVATVGALHVHPGATNVVPGEARASLDVRHADDAVRRAVTTRLRCAAEKIGGRRNVAVEWRQQLDQPAVACDAGLTAMLARAVQTNAPVQRMTSGAGHDAMIVAAIAPVAMLFLRSPGGISHHPAESVHAADVDAALAAGMAFLEELSDLMPDLVIRGGRGHRQLRRAARYRSGRWHHLALGPQLPGGREELTRGDLTIFPGLIDVHLHFNEPGRVEWEGAATGSRALAAGGGTLFFDMPLNSSPCTVDAAAPSTPNAPLSSSVVDHRLWPVGRNRSGQRRPTWTSSRARGVVGFKAFLCNSGASRSFPGPTI